MRTLVVADTGSGDDERAHAAADAVAGRSGAAVVHVPIVDIGEGLAVEMPGPVVVGSPDDAEALLASVAVPLLVAGPAITSPVLALDNVVIGVAGRTRSRHAIEVGAEWAKACALRCWLVEVVPDDGELDGEALEAIAARLNREGLTVGWDLLYHDDPVRAMVGFTRRMPATLLVFGAAPDGTLGPVGERLIREVPGPVLVVRSDE